MALKRVTGLVDVTGSNLKNVIDLTRALRDRLSDTQINLKPVAARIIAGLLSVVDKTTQAKLGRLVYAPLTNAAMNDIKKPMRDAALEALRSGTMASELLGGGINEEALEPFLAALVGEVTEASARVSCSTLVNSLKFDLFLRSCVLLNVRLVVCPTSWNLFRDFLNFFQTSMTVLQHGGSLLERSLPG